MSDRPPDIDPAQEEYWRNFLLNGLDPAEERLRPLLSKLPSDPRCKMCYSPFNGVGSTIMRLFFNRKRSIYNPTMCNYCEEHIKDHIGGAEIELSILFADVRGSTTLAEQMSIHEFRHLIDRFYQVGARVLIRHDAYIDKLIGDEVTGVFVPGISGPDHARKAIQAAEEILRDTGHGDPGGPWLPVGVGVHTGVAYMGTVGEPGGVVDMTVLGDAPNTASRLASNAGAGEVLVSDEAWTAAHPELPAVEQRHLQVKGRSKPVTVHVLRLTPVQTT